MNDVELFKKYRGLATLEGGQVHFPGIHGEALQELIKKDGFSDAGQWLCALLIQTIEARTDVDKLSSEERQYYIRDSSHSISLGVCKTTLTEGAGGEEIEVRVG